MGGDFDSEPAENGEMAKRKEKKKAAGELRNTSSSTSETLVLGLHRKDIKEKEKNDGENGESIYEITEDKKKTKKKKNSREDVDGDAESSGTGITYDAFNRGEKMFENDKAVKEEKKVKKDEKGKYAENSECDAETDAGTKDDGVITKKKKRTDVSTDLESRGTRITGDVSDRRKIRVENDKVGEGKKAKKDEKGKDTEKCESREKIEGDVEKTKKEKRTGVGGDGENFGTERHDDVFNLEKEKKENNRVARYQKKVTKDKNGKNAEHREFDAEKKKDTHKTMKKKKREAVGSDDKSYGTGIVDDVSNMAKETIESDKVLKVQKKVKNDKKDNDTESNGREVVAVDMEKDGNKSRKAKKGKAAKRMGYTLEVSPNKVSDSNKNSEFLESGITCGESNWGKNMVENEKEASKRNKLKKVIDLEEKRLKKGKTAKSIEFASEQSQERATNIDEISIAEDEGAAKDSANDGALHKKKRKEGTDHSANPQATKKSKRVRFSDKVEAFPPPNDTKCGEGISKEGLVQGKRFTPAEDAIVKEAVLNYIEVHGLGENGLDMVLNLSAHPELRGCWKEIGAALPTRPYTSVYYRAHVLFEGDQSRKWDPEEYEILRRHHKKYGSNWKPLAKALGKHRFHVKDAWRRIKLPNKKTGRWSQDEYQTLFELVNKDLCMKIFEEKKTKHGMLRDNIAWEAISEKLSTRTNPTCCKKWYDQLASSMVAEGIWANSDDYRLLKALTELDASCLEDVDWDNLVDGRDGELCLKRWKQMTKHIGGNKDKSFTEQVEVLSTRYCPGLLEVLQDYLEQET